MLSFSRIFEKKVIQNRCGRLAWLDTKLQLTDLPSVTVKHLCKKKEKKKKMGEKKRKAENQKLMPPKRRSVVVST